ncbi:replication initiation protein RepC [Roseibium sp. TrichSKD4]|uniref:replication initiation protein RepC n=1 Tax=Roseibium sp. TrichSKD4 TaxID=744980 RepID=UPI001AD8AD7E|nr:replication initiation protein RepC [Roseibium sp. TrichSKD4]
MLGPRGPKLHNRASCGTKADQQFTIDLTEGPDRGEADTLESVSIGLIAAACSLTQDETDTRFASWIDLLAAVQDMRVLIGLSEAGYAQAVLRHGKHLPAACLAVVTEKALRDPHQITSPGGYFRAMIDRASDHKLNLKKSLFGLANN